MRLFVDPKSPLPLHAQIGDDCAGGGIMKSVNILTVLIWLAGGAAVVAAYFASMPLGAVVAIGIATFILSLSPQIADQWDRAIVLRLGKFDATKGPGFFF